MHPAGPFTIHFWAPTFKWGISLANIMDMGDKDISQVSVAQQVGKAVYSIYLPIYLCICIYNLTLFTFIFSCSLGLLRYRVSQQHQRQVLLGVYGCFGVLYVFLLMQ